MFPFGVTVEVIKVTRDRHGDATTTAVGSIEGCAFAPESSVEDTDNREQVISAGALYVPPTQVEVSAACRLRFDGAEWQVDGDPAWWRHPMTGWTPGGVIHVRRVTG